MEHSNTIATMKNLFMSLMLVAVAAMGFTACEKENNENNNGAEQKTVITFNAEFADTRSYFTENNGEGYPSAWTEGDEAEFVVNTYESSWGYWYGYDRKTVAIDADNCFKATLYPNYGDTIIAYTPSSQWNILSGSTGYAGTYSIPAEQTPTATSVDAKAHILKAETTYEGSNNMSLKFEHQVAYGKMSLTNFAGSDVKQYILTINGTMYTVNAPWTEDVWFACEPATVTDMSISVVAAEGTYTKTLDFSTNSLSFVKGQVSTFVVDMANVTIGEAVDTYNPDLTMEYKAKYNSYFDFKADGYISIRFYLHSDDRPGNNSIKPGTYACTGTNATPSSTGQYGFRISDGYSATMTASDLKVSYDYTKNEYTITFEYNGKVFGYRGMPNGWVAPPVVEDGGNDGGNEGGDSNVVTVTGIASTTNAGKTYTFNCTPQLTISFAMTDYKSTGTYELRAGYSGESNVCNVMYIGDNTPTSVSGSISYTWSLPNAIITFNDVVIDGITFKGENLTYSLM